MFVCFGFFLKHFINLMLYCCFTLGSLSYIQISFLRHIDCVLNEYSKMAFY